MFSIDPGLLELVAAGSPEDEIMVVIRVRDSSKMPARARIVARFGTIATCRVRRSDILAVHNDPDVASMKAPSPVIADVFDESVLGEDERRTDVRRPDVPQTGSGVVFASVDWGFDFAHPNFRTNDGRTRALALWDQGGIYDGNAYGYGAVHDRSAIDAALASADPYATLNYDPRASDPQNVGTHATHVVDIAVGNGLGCTPVGVAPQADIIFVHLAQGLGPTALGDSVTLLEAIDFIARTAGDQPWVLGLSMGNMGGPHDGATLVELAFDELLRGSRGRAIAQSCGNYYARMAHTKGELHTGERTSLLWKSDRAALTPNELEIWYDGADRFAVTVEAPSGATSRSAALGNIVPMYDDGRLAAQIYHRPRDPNNGDNHIHIYLYPGFQPGVWRVHLLAEHAKTGRYHAWIERDEECSGCQSHFVADQAVVQMTTGTICHARHAISVGAYDLHAADFALASFSSSGPTRDGRDVPRLIAPGVAILAARSVPLGAPAGTAGHIRKSGTSMAQPQVSGAIALLLEAAPALSPEQLCSLLANGAQREGLEPRDRARTGAGRLSIETALAAVSSLQTEDTTVTTTAIPPTIVGKFSIGGTHVTIDTSVATQAISSATLDDAIAFALSKTGRNSYIIGSLLGGKTFDVWHFTVAVPVLDDVVDFDAQASVCALIVGGELYVPSDPTSATRRWVRLPRADEFYALSDADRSSQRGAWITKILGANPAVTLNGTAVSKKQLRGFSMPELRLLLAHFGAQCFRVIRQDSGSAHGGLVNGTTLPLMISPLREPDVYVRVIARREGRLEAINAWDQGAGISLGAVQINVIKGLLFRFLGELSTHDPALLQSAIATPLNWNIVYDTDHFDVVTAAGQTLHGRAASADVKRNFAFFQSGNPGTPDAAAIDVDFRMSIAAAFRDAVVWPHAQEMLNRASIAYLQPGLDMLTAAGIASLDPANPDRDTFILKAVLLGAFVRASASLQPLLDALANSATTHDKLAALTPDLVEVALEPVIKSKHIRDEVSARINALTPTALDVLNTVRNTLSLPPVETVSLDTESAQRVATQVLAQTESTEGFTPARLFDMRAPYAAQFEVIATPLSKLPVLHAGDVVVRRVLGESSMASIGIAVEDTPLSSEGQYASLVSLRNPSAPPSQQRITNQFGRLSADTLVVRPREDVEAPEDIDGSALTWSGATPDQLGFMQAVYAQHVANSRSTGRPFIGDVDRSRLDVVENSQLLRIEAAAQCRSMLASVRNDLATAQSSGIGGAREITSIIVNSGYRSASRQFGIWQSNFRKYYRETASQRATFSDPHGSDAISFLARYIGQRVGAPGYSNHNDGRAVDLGATMTQGRSLGADTSDAAIALWRGSWLFTWLSSNAATYNFFQNTSINEPWHWEYRAPAQPIQSISEGAVSAGKLYLSNTPLLKSHKGTQPDLYVCWNAMASIPTAVNVVIHLHGYSTSLGAMQLSAKVADSGLDFTDPSGTVGRSAPTVGIIPRGSYEPSDTRADRYAFPALLSSSAIGDLITYALEQFTLTSGAGGPVSAGRSILTCHSGGGNPLEVILANNDFDEIHLFDAMYYTPQALLTWIARHIASDDAGYAGTSALRMFYTPSKSTTPNANNIAQRIQRELRKAKNTAALSPFFRVEETTIGHPDIPRAYGWQLLADASANVPKTRRILAP